MINDFKAKVVKIIESKKFLGLAVEEKCLLAADMYYDGDKYQLNNTSSLVFPEGVSFENPGKMGELFRRFLNDNGFTSRKAVIGIPAKWFMLREKTLPPSTRDSAAGILKIHAEREFSMGADKLIIDYSGHVSEENASSLFLGALRRTSFENVLETARVAGLNVLSITPTSIALRKMAMDQTGRTFPDFFLYLRPDFAEILTGENDHVTGIKHIQRGKPSEMDQVASEIKRIISFYSGPESEASKLTLMIWDASDHDGQDVPDIRDSILPDLDIVEIDFKAINRRTGTPSGSRRAEPSVPATLVPAFNEGGAYYLDFYNSRMDVKNSIVTKKHVGWASALILALIIFLANMVFTWKSDKNDVISLRTRLEEMSPDINSARDTIQKVNLARGWYSERPEILRCLREITLSFPVEGTVWATNLALNENMKGIVSGKAVDEKSVLEVLDNLKDNDMFSNIQMIHIRENGQASQEVSFSMSFSFKGRGL